jgi:hypothetical protein
MQYAENILYWQSIQQIPVIHEIIHSFMTQLILREGETVSDTNTTPIYVNIKCYLGAEYDYFHQ